MLEGIRIAARRISARGACAERGFATGAALRCHRTADMTHFAVGGNFKMGNVFISKFGKEQAVNKMINEKNNVS